ncbi:MAG TPA: response regulator [Geobacteraceae bacterium]|nr:response regulator [Geobacteraceae bacterium]
MNSDTGQKRRILVVDDEAAIRRYLRIALNSEEFDIHEAEDGHTALATAVSVRPDLVILDLGLPDLDGVEVLRRLREWSEVPVIILSVRDREDDKIKALDAGADDYLTKPFGTGELLARIRASMRRSRHAAPEPVYRIDELVVDLARRRVTVRDREIQLTPTEYELLRLLIVQEGKVMTHRQILQKIWGSAHLEQPNILRVTMSNLRRKIEEDASRPKYILTELGVGYRMKMY